MLVAPLIASNNGTRAGRSVRFLRRQRTHVKGESERPTSSRAGTVSRLDRAAPIFGSRASGAAGDQYRRRIAPADQALIFEEFRQVGGDGDRRREETGLGLALTKRVSSSCMAGVSASPAKWARARRSPSRCRRGHDQRADPNRGGQREEPEAGARRASALVAASHGEALAKAGPARAEESVEIREDEMKGGVASN